MITTSYHTHITASNDGPREEAPGKVHSLLNKITIPTDRTPLSNEDSNHVYTELKDGNLSDEDFKTVLVKVGQLYRNGLKNREFDKEALQNFDLERVTIVQGQGASEDRNFEGQPTRSKTDSSVFFGLVSKSDFIYNALVFDRDEGLALRLLTDDHIESKGQDHLFTASRTGHQKVVQRLLESDHVNINGKDRAGQTALFHACKTVRVGEDLEDKANKQHQMLTLLLNAGADVKAVSNDGDTILMQLLRRKDNEDPSACAQNLKLAELLVSKGADINAQNKKGESALSLAPNLEWAQWLHSQGANIDAVNQRGESVIELIKSNEIIRYLVQVGADIQVKRDDETFIHRKLLYASKEEVAAYLNISEQEGEKVQNDYRNRFFLGHFNSISDPKLMNFERSNASAMCSEMATILADLPESLGTYIVPKEKQELIEAFKLGGKQDLDKDKIVSLIHKGKLAVLPIGFLKHTIYVVFCNGYMTILNRGDGVPEIASKWPAPIRKLLGIAKTSYETIKAYKVNSELFSEEMLEELVQGKRGKREGVLKYLYDTLPSLLAPNGDKKPVQDTICKQLESLHPKVQKIENCSFTQAKLSARVAKAMINIKGVDEKPTLDEAAVHSAYAFSKDFSSHIRLTAIDRYLANHLIGSDGTADIGLLMQTYQKLKKRFDKFPDLHFYPNFQKWAKKLEGLRLQEWSMQVNKLTPFYT